MTTRYKLLSDLRAATGCKTHAALMDELQDRGLVSDEAVSLDHVPDGDLLSALLKVQNAAKRAGGRHA